MTSFRRSLITGLLGLSISLNALSQQSVVDRCRAASSDTDRIACLEAALLARQTLPLEPSAETPNAKPGPEATVAPVVATLPDTHESAPPIAETAPADAMPVGIGAEQVIARIESPEERRAGREELRGEKVASYAYVPYERLVVQLENGQVWRQIKGDTQRVRADLKRNQTVDISAASMSGYKLRLNEMRRTIRVERVR